MAGVKGFVWVIAVTIYLLGGAGVFNLLESPSEVRRHQEAAVRLQELLKNLTCIGGGRLKELLEVVDDLSGASITYSNNTLEVVTDPGMWAYDQAFFFCISILSTIGYGNVSPSTFASRTFCVFYALFGIPLFLILLVRTGAWIAKLNDRIIARLSRNQLQANRKQVVQVIMVGVSGFVFMILLPSLAFVYSEGWSYDIALYYSFITMSTIGFGDYVPGSRSHTGVRIAFAFWIAFGLAWFSTLIATIQNIMGNSGQAESDKQNTKDKVVPVGNGHSGKSALHNVPQEDIITSYL